VVQASGAPVPARKPIVGGSVFTHESGIHVSGLARDPKTYEALDPETFGRTRRIVLGKHSGMGSVLYGLQKLGYEADPSQMRRVLEQVRAYAIHSKRAIDLSELIHFCDGHEPSSVS
jgi:homocitrate synthase NifV